MNISMQKNGRLVPALQNLSQLASVALICLVSACGGGSDANIPGFAGPPPVVIVPPPPPPPGPILPPATAKNWCGANQIQTLKNNDDAEDPKVALGQNGSAIVVWNQQYDGFLSIRARRYSQSSSWGVEDVISDLVSGNTAFGQQISSDSNGNMMAIWQQGSSGNYDIWASRYTPLGGWGARQRIETGSGDAGGPQLSTDSDGNVMAAWSQRDGVNYSIWANRFTPTGGWGTAQLIETDDAGSAFSPQLVSDSSGNVMAVWQQRNGIRLDIWANRFTPAGGWGTAQLIETDNSGNAQNPRLDVTASGQVVAAWLLYNGTQTVLNTNRYTPGSGWGTATQIPTGAVEVNDGAFTVDSNGHVLAVWNQRDALGSLYSMWSVRFDASTGWGSAQLIETDSVFDVSSPRIASDGYGNSVVIWIQRNGSTYQVKTNRYTAGSGWGTTQSLETSNRYTVYSGLTVDTAGNAMAVWAQEDGGEYKRIYANAYASTCPVAD